jgi:glycosyltransferase involved in cell wall biosynthesis
VHHNFQRPIRRIGFVATRISGNDGVSLEIAKWTDVLQHLGYECFFVAGKCDRDPECSFLIDEADFRHPVIQEINAKCFGRKYRIRQMSRLIRTTARTIKDQLYEAADKFNLDLIIAENAMTIPMNIPLGVALEEMLLETEILCIAHHHDFVWERERFMVNGVEDYIAGVFPPRLSHMHHVVINSLAGSEFSRRTGLSFRVIPNVMNFDQPPPPIDHYSQDFRKTIGVAEDDLLILQPTRVVQRKGIEHSIELVRRLENPRCKLVITHSYDDEGLAYYDRIRQYAELLGVELIFANQWICHRRRTAADGKKCYTIWDSYPHADLVAYPSTYEGFGNAFLEAIYYKKPIFCNRYAIYRTDIEPYGFKAVVMDGFITDDILEEVRRVLTDDDYRQEMVDHNYQIAKRHFSYVRLENELRAILSSPQPSPAS